MTTARYSLVATITNLLPKHLTNKGRVTQTIEAAEASTGRSMFLLCSGKVVDVCGKLRIGDLIAVNGSLSLDHMTLTAPKVVCVLDVGNLTVLSEAMPDSND
jgi:hypothetical protein